MDKAERYVDKAIVQISKTRTQTGESPLLSSFHVMLIEHMIQCRLVTGNKAKAVTELGLLTKLLSSNTMLLQHHRAQLHTLLGLYAMSMSCMEAAESQFNCALRTSKERELWTFSNLNLAIVYLRQRRDRDFMALLDRISPDQLPSASHCMKAAAYYIHGLQSFFSSQYGESKRYLRETLKMANQEDLNRLTSCSLVLLGHIFLSLNNPKESMNMVTPAMQLAGKIPDVNVQLWATAILKVRDCHGFGSVRSSKCHNVCPSVCPAQVCLKQVADFSHILLSLAAVFGSDSLQEHSESIKQAFREHSENI